MENVYELSCEWEGKIAVCSSYEKAFSLGKEWHGSESDDAFKKELDCELFSITAIPLNKICY